MSTRTRKNKPFPLFEGDVVWFQSATGIRQGTLLQRPYGRRLFAVVRTSDRMLHYVPKRDDIIRKASSSA